MIREIAALVAGAYGAITLLQILSRPTLTGQGIVIGLFLVLGAGLYWYREKEILERVEMTVLWCCIFLFVAYAGFAGVTGWR